MEQEQEALQKSKKLRQLQAEIDNILGHTLSVDDFYDLRNLRRSVDHPEFQSQFLNAEPPPAELPESDRPVLQTPRPPGFISRIFGGVKRYDMMCKAAEEQLERDLEIWELEIAALPGKRSEIQREWAERERIREECLLSERAEYERECRERDDEVRQANEELEETIKGLAEGSAEAVEKYLRVVLERSSYPEGLHPCFWLCFREEDATLKMIGEIAPPSALPSIKDFKFAMSEEALVQKSKSEKELKNQYETFVANVALRTIHEVLEADRGGVVKWIDLTLTTHHGQRASSAENQGIPLLITRVPRQDFLKTPLSTQAPVQRIKLYDTLLSKNPSLLFPISEDEQRRKQEKIRIAEERATREAHTRSQALEAQSRKNEERIRIAEERTARESYISGRQLEAQSKTEALWAVQREIRQILSVGIASEFDLDKMRMSESPPHVSGLSGAVQQTESSARSEGVRFDGGIQVDLMQESHNVGLDFFQYTLQAQRHNAEIDAILQGFDEADTTSVRSYFLKMFQHSGYPLGFKPEISVDFNGLSRELAVLVAVIGPHDMPTISEYVYTRSSDSIVEKKLSRSAMKELYEDYISGVTIRTAVEVWSANRNDVVRSLSLRVLASDVVPGTSRTTSVCVVEWAPTRTEIQTLISVRLEPKCLLDRSRAIVSRNLFKLSPIPAGRNIGRFGDV
jgi:restriction system protein